MASRTRPLPVEAAREATGRSALNPVTAKLALVVAIPPSKKSNVSLIGVIALPSTEVVHRLVPRENGEQVRVPPTVVTASPGLHPVGKLPRESQSTLPVPSIVISLATFASGRTPVTSLEARSTAEEESIPDASLFTIPTPNPERTISPVVLPPRVRVLF